MGFFAGATVTGPQRRKLAAILAADIAGYSALMGVDEDATVRDRDFADDPNLWWPHHRYGG